MDTSLTFYCYLGFVFTSQKLIKDLGPSISRVRFLLVVHCPHKAQLLETETAEISITTEKPER